MPTFVRKITLHGSQIGTKSLSIGESDVLDLDDRKEKIKKED